MKVGDLVKLKYDPGPYGFVIRIDEQYFGARQAIKIYKNVLRGQAIRSNMGDGIGPTSRGIRDRILVEWVTHGCEYIESDQLEVVSEGR